jgi:formamidopyrimidine-DNA glycosylase
MPELPEVETICRGLSKLIVGKKIVNADGDNPRSYPNSQADVDSFVIDAKIKGIQRRGKALLIDLSSGYSLVIHLKMTGQLVFVGKENRFGAGHPNDSLISNLPDKTTHVTFEFDDGSYMYFNDQRKCGWVNVVPTVEVAHMEFINKLGPDVFDSKLTQTDFVSRFRRRNNTSIKAAMLDQSVVAGIGNIYTDEALWGAKIHPAKLVRDLSDADLKRIFEQVKYVMSLAIEKGGSTDRNYVNAEGKKGNYLEFANVFRREGDHCPRCGHEIIKIRVAGRGTHICPHDQVL